MLPPLLPLLLNHWLEAKPQQLTGQSLPSLSDSVTFQIQVLTTQSKKR